MCVEEGKEVIAENFHKLLAAVLVRVASTAGVQAPLKPVNSAKVLCIFILIEITVVIFVDMFMLL